MTILPSKNQTTENLPDSATAAQHHSLLSMPVVWFTGSVLKPTAQAWDAILSNLKTAPKTIMGRGESDTNQPSGFGLYVDNNVFLPVKVLQESDAEMLKSFLDGLSPDAKYTRFHRPMGDNVPFRVAQYLADRDGKERVALVALNPEGNSIVAMVEYALPKEDTIPEVAYVVADEWQGKRIASQMINILGVLSYAGGHTQWTASILSSNRPARKLLKHVGDVTLMSSEAGVNEYKVTLNPNQLFAN